MKHQHAFGLDKLDRTNESLKSPRRGGGGGSRGECESKRRIAGIVAEGLEWIGLRREGELEV